MMHMRSEHTHPYTSLTDSTATVPSGHCAAADSRFFFSL